MARPMNAIDPKSAKKLMGDIEVWGVEEFKLVSKASSKKYGFMKSTKAMQLPAGCLIQVSTKEGNAVAEALTYVPDVYLVDLRGDEGDVTGRVFMSRAEIEEVQAKNAQAIKIEEPSFTKVGAEEEGVDESKPKRKKRRGKSTDAGDPEETMA